MDICWNCWKLKTIELQNAQHKTLLCILIPLSTVEILKKLNLKLLNLIFLYINTQQRSDEHKS
jgi:hypothetical protein